MPMEKLTWGLTYFGQFIYIFIASASSEVSVESYYVGLGVRTSAFVASEQSALRASIAVWLRSRESIITINLQQAKF